MNVRPGSALAVLLAADPDEHPRKAPTQPHSMAWIVGGHTQSAEDAKEETRSPHMYCLHSTPSGTELQHLPDMALGRSYLTLACTEQYVVVLGGVARPHPADTQNITPSSETAFHELTIQPEVFDVRLQRWLETHQHGYPRLPESLMSAAAVAVPGAILLVGGCNGTSSRILARASLLRHVEMQEVRRGRLVGPRSREECCLLSQILRLDLRERWLGYVHLYI